MSGPLDGVRVLVLRPEHQAGELAGLLEEHGAVPVVVPAIRIVPPASWTKADEAITRAPNFDWVVFTSVNGVDSVLNRMEETGSDLATLPERVGAIGPGTRRALEAHGVAVEWMPSSFTSAMIAEQLPDPPAKVLLVRADIATADLDEALRARGFEVTRIDAYGTEVCNHELVQQALGEVDAVALTSASIARSFVDAAGDRAASRGIAVCSIGPATSAECRGLGVEVTVEAADHTMAGLVEALKGYFREQRGRSPAPHETSRP
ncbi:MAG TPA: uroporphyrinogen-III synthase [Actinomycetota bacterium]|nr:uroporphyrinogen-III synthase [Actinomycetota bacterium]